MFGQHFAQTIQELKKYVIKYGEKPIPPYFNAIHWDQNLNGDVTLSKVELSIGHTDEFISGLNDLYSVELVKETFRSADKEDAVSHYFDRLCASTITSGNVGDYSELHLCLYISLYEAEFWEQAKTLIAWLKSLKNRLMHIDLVGFTSDLASVIHAEDETTAQQKKVRELQSKTTIQEIVKYRNENQDNVEHFLVMQNTQTRGISLNLNHDSFVRVLGEFAMTCVENYQIVFPLPRESEKELQSFGLSVLHFDKYYFIEYLLHKAYQFAMEREGIQKEAVDINIAFNKSKDILKDRIYLLSDFFKKEVLPRLDKKQEENHIVAEVAPLLNAKLNEIGSDCDTIIKDKKISIPVKRAILTALLGYDDELFVNTIFDDNTLIFDDLDSEAMNVFINANNALLYQGKGRYEYTDEEKEQANKAILSKNNEPVIYPLNDMKKLRLEMQRRMSYVRDLESQRKKMESQIGNISESKKCLVEGEFYVFGEHKFRLLPKIEEIPLNEDYVPHVANVASIDLRENFTNIKSQGQQGSCTAHVLASIYEYILKSNKAQKTDLSEAFLYYNARKKAGKEHLDEGSIYHLAIEALMEFGICEESLMPYSENDFTTSPTEEAFDDALLRRVRKAVNVKRNINDLKSALEDGYPVAICAVLYDSFGQGHKGIVSLPTQEELETVQNVENKHRHHAMVVCGYSDENKLFIVRNSWGTDFGDNGYCYMPYSYMTDENLVPFAAAITEIETAEKYSVLIKKSKSVLRFDETDIAIRLAITNNLISEEHLLLRKNESDYNSLRASYELLKQLLKNPNKQSSLRNSTKERIAKEIQNIGESREKVRTEKYKQLDKFDKQTRETEIKLSLMAAAIVVVVFLLAYFVGWRVFAWKYTWYSFGVVTAIVSSLFLYFPYRKKKRRELELGFDEELEQLAIRKANKVNELVQINLKMHIAGHFLTKLFELQSAVTAKYNATSSFLSNLKAWYSEESKTINQLDANTQLPFISLLKNKDLDTYFETYKRVITEHISLCEKIVDFSERIENETISKKDLKQCKDAIKESCVRELEVLIKNFDIYSYLCNQTVRYEFLDADSKFIAEILPKLDEKSHIFLCDNGTSRMEINKFIAINAPTDDDARQWERFYPRYFTDRPNSLSFLSPYKVMVIQLADLNISQIN